MMNMSDKFQLAADSVASYMNGSIHEEDLENNYPKFLFLLEQIPENMNSRSNLIKKMQIKAMPLLVFQFQTKKFSIRTL